ncbi:5-hydroxytryptamine receptor 2A-like [Limulus polyphemus]|uniref:5-hydroxytryptamine receptor 2A-like n=1 Tax=Limulus polyphemus TaxID=6850 RepID=A0ABM1B9Z7_LIMPO|nr:5-hydroxytryptamine receptor 2A-like [Limulus polyphemus]
MVLVVSLSSLLSLLILFTVVGNIFVISSILLDRNLRRVGNYLILSLAVADLMVACLVMPLSAMYEVEEKWPLGPVLCDMWTSCDVLCCTASILHLLAIAVDRYRAVTRIDYVRQRNVRDISIMIFLVWVIALVISVAPIFGWKDPNFEERIFYQQKCLISQDVAYQIFATFSSFYVPLVAILVLYWRIYQEARRRIRNKPGKNTPVTEKKRGEESAELSTIPNTLTCTNSDPPQTSCSVVENRDLGSSQKKDRGKQLKDIEAKREKKAAKTLAIITGVFIVCWLPFFVLAVIMPICSSCEPNEKIFSMSQWLGYTNSMLNPIIYTIFSPDFRRAFNRVLCGGKRQRATIM